MRRKAKAECKPRIAPMLSADVSKARFSANAQPAEAQSGARLSTRAVERREKDAVFSVGAVAEGPRGPVFLVASSRACGAMPRFSAPELSMAGWRPSAEWWGAVAGGGEGLADCARAVRRRQMACGQLGGSWRRGPCRLCLTAREPLADGWLSLMAAARRK